MSPVFMESNLFEAAELGETVTIDGGHGLRMFRRMLALAWLLAGGVDGLPGEAPCAASVAWWGARGYALHDSRPATLTTILFQLQALGPVVDFAEAPGGFHVQLREGE